MQSLEVTCVDITTIGKSSSNSGSNLVTREEQVRLIHTIMRPSSKESP